MKHSRNRLLALVFAFLLIFSLTSIAEAQTFAHQCGCPEGEVNLKTYSAEPYCTEHNARSHKIIRNITEYCDDCKGWIRNYNVTITIVDLISSRGTRFLKNDATHHWYTTPIYWNCPTPNCQEGGHTEYDDETKYTHDSAVNWVDGGHSGGSHNFYRYCDTCGYRFDSLTVPCPGGDNHASIYQIPNLPIESETE